MNGSFVEAWKYLGTDLWSPLAAADPAPLSLFADLYAAAGDRLAPQPSLNELAEVRAEPSLAESRFLALSGTDFSSELGIVAFLHDARLLIAEYGSPDLNAIYLDLLAAAVNKFNLRYRVDSDMTLRFMLSGSFSNLYSELLRINSSDPHLTELLTAFEEAFDDYVRRESDSNLKTCISKASNYAEGLASHTRNYHSGTLGRLAKQIGGAPHEKLEEALVNVYHFCCDYPGIRHGGKPRSARRPLTAVDGTVAAMLLMTFAAYLTPDIRPDALLGS